MRALAIALVSALLAFAPTVAADPDLPPQPPIGPDPVGCLTGPVIPESFVYYFVWECTAGQLGVPEPVELATGCTIEFPLRLQCTSASPLDDADRVEDCARSGDLSDSCVFNVEPSPVACLVNYALTRTPCR